MPERSAIFIDGAYLFNVLRNEFGDARVNFGLLPSKLTLGTNLIRTYYYSSLPYRSDPPTTRESAFYNRQRQFFSALKLLPIYTVKLGRVERRGTRDDGSPVTEQKRVDILLAVDLVKLSANGHIQQAVLIAGDSDFIPAIEAAKSEGVVVKLFHGANCHRELLEEVDEHYRVDQPLVDSIRRRDRDSGV